MGCYLYFWRSSDRIPCTSAPEHMPVNESKIRSQRQWEKWRSSGAVGSVPEQPATTLTSWETILGKFNLMTSNDPDNSRRELISNNHGLLRDFYDGWFNVAAGKGRDRLNEVTRKYATDEASPDYNPERIDELSLFITTIRDSFPNISTKRK